MTIREISTCRLCDSGDLVSVLDLGDLALTGHFPLPGEQVPSAPVELVWCVSCDLLQLRHAVELSVMYGDNYGYRSGLNRSMVNHLQGIASRLSSLVDIQPDNLVVDVGANDGTLLSCYQAKKIGIDPTIGKWQAAGHWPADAIGLSEFFDAEKVLNASNGQRARIVTAIAMAYDLEDPRTFVSQIESILAPDGVLLLEVCYAPTMLAECLYDAICHEHLEYYGLRQIKAMLDNAGLIIVDASLNRTNGGSLQVVAARKSADYGTNDIQITGLLEFEESRQPRLSNGFRFRDAVSRHARELRDWVHGVNGRGRAIAVYGASTKGNVMLQVAGLSGDDFIGVAEVNPDKFGRETPGSRIPIRSEAAIRAQSPDYMLVLPWHFRRGIVARERAYLASGGALVFPLPTREVVLA